MFTVPAFVLKMSNTALSIQLYPLNKTIQRRAGGMCPTVSKLNIIWELQSGRKTVMAERIRLGSIVTWDPLSNLN